jgi:hypothetical protein
MNQPEDDGTTESVLNKDVITHFEEFGHIMLVGTTNVGKTTYFLHLLSKGLFDFDDFIYLAPDTKQLANVAHHVNYYFRVVKNIPGEMRYFNLDNIREFKKYLETSKSAHKFVFMDDSFVTGRTSQKSERMDLLMMLKNLKSTAAYTVHDAFHDNKGARLAARYIIACNLNESDFNRLFKLAKNNKLWELYKQEEDYHNRVIIFDNVKQKYYNKNLIEIKQ